MAILDQQTIYKKQTEERLVGGHSDDANDKYEDLDSLKRKLDVMYQYRNNEIKDADNTGTIDKSPGVIENVCNMHAYKSFTEYQQAIGVDYSLSLGDLNDALNAMSYCTCNSRSLGGCNCVTRTAGNSCSCNLRSPYTCMCVYRNGNKYVQGCNCDVRDSGCSCVSRTSSAGCSCNSRCSCNVVNEYEKAVPPKECTCVSRNYDTGCQCDARTVTYDKAKNPPSGPCNIVDASSGCLCVARDSGCGANVGCDYVGWECGGHVQPQKNGCCTCDVRTSNESDIIRSACQCVTRTPIIGCTYNVVKMDADGKNNLPSNQKA